MASSAYETNLINLLERFATDDDCRKYLEALRWPNGVACIRCGDMDVTRPPEA